MKTEWKQGRDKSGEEEGRRRRGRLRSRSDRERNRVRARQMGSGEGGAEGWMRREKKEEERVIKTKNKEIT